MSGKIYKEENKLFREEIKNAISDYGYLMSHMSEIDEGYLFLFSVLNRKNLRKKLEKFLKEKITIGKNELLIVGAELIDDNEISQEFLISKNYYVNRFFKKPGGIVVFYGINYKKLCEDSKVSEFFYKNFIKKLIKELDYSEYTTLYTNSYALIRLKSKDEIKDIQKVLNETKDGDKAIIELITEKDKDLYEIADHILRGLGKYYALVKLIK